MYVRQMLHRARERLVIIGHGAPVRDAADLMSKPHTDLVVVCDTEGVMVGVLTKTDIVRKIGQCSGQGCTARADTIKTREVISCRADQPLQDIWSIMKQKSLQRIPVVDQSNRPIGIIYARDALQNLLGEMKDEEGLLRDYVMNVGYQ